MSGKEPVAVLLCFRHNEPEVRLCRAISSTAAQAPEGTMFFLHADGGEPAGGRKALDAAAGGCVVDWTISSNSAGLATGLNRLIDKVLARGEFEFLARMDADDVSAEGRLARQRDFLQHHASVDILGTSCRELDERGNFLQTKILPAAHEEIVSRLVWRNPMNHPTIMLRRRVFEKGLRYRTDVRLMEDYFLWIEAAACGFRFANLTDPLLDYTRDSGFFGRRSGWVQACAEWKARRYAARTLQVSGPAAWVSPGSAFALRLLPAGLQTFLYKKLR